LWLLALTAALVGPGLRPVTAAVPAPAVARLFALHPDSTRARQALVRAEAAAVRLGFDSLLVAPGAAEPKRRARLEAVARDYLTTFADSLLLRDLEFTSGLDAGRGAGWFAGVRAEEAGLQARAAQDHAGAAAHFEAAAQAYATAGDLRREAVVLGTLGVAWWSAGDLEAAGRAYERALEARQRLGDPLLVGRTLNALGSVAMRLSDYPQALRRYEAARDVRRRIGDRGGLGVTLSYIGNVHYLRGDLVAARTSYIEALEVLGDQARPADLHPARLGLANVHWALGEYREALALYRREKDQLRAQGEARELAATQRNLAQTLRVLGDYGGALDELRQARETQEAAGDRWELAATLNSMAIVHLDLGDLPRALDVAMQAEKVAREAGNAAELARILDNQALVQQLLGYAERARETYEKAHAEALAAGDTLAVRSALVGLGHLHFEKREHEAALRRYRDALAIDLRQGSPLAGQDRLDIGNALARLGDLEAARREFGAAVQLGRDTGSNDLLWKSFLGLAECHDRAGELDSARVYNARAIQLLEHERSPDLSEDKKATLLARSAFAYEAQIDVLARLHERRPERGFAALALATAEQGKARALVDLLQESHMDLSAGLDPQLVNERVEVERRLTGLQYQLRTLAARGAPADTLAALRRARTQEEERRSTLLDRLRRSNPRFATLDAGQPSTPAELGRDLLRDGRALLLEYSLGDSASYAWAVTKRGVVQRRLAPRATIEAAVQRLRAALVDPTPAGDRGLVAASVALHDLVLAPLRDQLRGKRELYLVPDGALHLVPFEALVQRQPPGDAAAGDAAARAAFLADLPYALDGVHVRYGPSATVLAVLQGQRGRRTAPPPADLLAIGAPSFDAAPAEDTTPDADGGVDPGGVRSGLVPLPHTGAEIDAIGALFAPERRTLLRGAAARERTLVEPGYLQRYRILHFATHGLVDARRPERSSLALAFPQDPSEDGALQASEIYQLRLDADVVVLSACETGLGQNVRGEGVLGLPRAFLFAGASSVVVSLWSVADRSTSEFMQAFYRDLVQRRLPPAAALAEARRALRRDARFAHPFYWAPFVVIGPAG
jgi:CHAT domain-containing protein/tetratricopeptide (TPR) repeat protein